LTSWLRLFDVLPQNEELLDLSFLSTILIFSKYAGYSSGAHNSGKPRDSMNP